MVTKVKVEGTARLARTLKDAGAEVADLTDLNRQVGGLVAGSAQGKAPIASGALAGSIAGKGTKTAGVVTASVPYAGVQEFGWPARNITAQPFGIPALEGQEGAIVDAYERKLAEVIGRVKGA